MDVKRYNENMIQQKKVCHLSSVHLSSDPRIFDKECVTLAQNGYQVTLIAKGPTDERKGVTRISFPNMHRLRRIIFSNYKMLDLAKEVDAEIYHLHDPELLPLVAKLKKLGKKVIFDSHENVSEQILHKEYLPKKLRRIISVFYRHYERVCLRNVDMVIIVTPSQYKNFEGISQNIKMVTNYPTKGEDDSNFSEMPISAKRCQVCFAGSISSQWNHNLILDAVYGLSDITYAIAGPIHNKDLFKLLNSSSEKIKYFGFLDREQLKKLYSESICGMALLSYNTQVGREGTLGNTKLFEYMKFGLPVICSDLNLWKEIVSQNECGLTINPNNIIEIRKAIKFLVNNPEEAVEMGRNGYKAFLNTYNWDTQAPQLLEIYSSIFPKISDKDFVNPTY